MTDIPIGGDSHGLHGPGDPRSAYEPQRKLGIPPMTEAEGRMRTINVVIMWHDGSTQIVLDAGGVCMPMEVVGEVLYISRQPSSSEPKKILLAVPLFKVKWWKEG